MNDDQKIIKELKELVDLVRESAEEMIAENIRMKVALNDIYKAADTHPKCGCVQVLNISREFQTTNKDDKQ